MGVTINIPKAKNGSKIIIGSKITIGSYDRLYILVIDQHFNWFQKKMIKICFGFTVEDYKEE